MFCNDFDSCSIIVDCIYYLIYLMCLIELIAAIVNYERDKEVIIFDNHRIKNHKFKTEWQGI